MRSIAVAFPLFILMAVVILLPILVGVYVYRDANRRGMNDVLWTLIAILAPSLIGFIIYLLVRGNYSNLKCPRCETAVTEQYVVCPKCGAKLRPSCPNCSVPVESDWTICPKCTQPLTEIHEDIVTPVRPKDKTLWKILIAIVVIPVLLILVLGISFSAVSGGGFSSLREVTFDEFYADEELSDNTKEYIQEWIDTLPKELHHVYALRYEHEIDPKMDTKDYYYLIYIPGGGETGRYSFGYSSGLFSDAFKLDLEAPSNQDGLYCAMTTSKKSAPKLKITMNGKSLDVDVIDVEFNPTLYTVVSKSDYGNLVNASGDLYVESYEVEMKPTLAVIREFSDSR